MIFSGFSQPGKEAWHWQFGDNAALNFSSGLPVIGTGSVQTIEGTASISDRNTGQLLFYTDGINVFDKTNYYMPHGYGLLGNGFTTQSALIIPKPGSTNLYYIFTCGAQGGAIGVNYSIVDMNLRGGLGDVVVPSKNTPLTPAPVTEKLVGLKQCNGSDYWVITHPFQSNCFNAYSVTAAGINPVPVVSCVGLMESGNGYFGAQGYLKASPNGKKLALAVTNNTKSLELFDFNALTGVVSHPVTMTFTPNRSGPYGVEFSPDNSKLYTTVQDSLISHLYQFDLSSGVDSIIIASKILLSTSATYAHFDAIQMGPDKRLYVAVNNTSDVGKINYPNLAGAACGFQPYIINLGFPIDCNMGLPNFVNSYNNGAYLTNSVKCGTFTTDTLDAGTGFSSYQWSTGANTQSIVVNSPGTYWVKVSNSNGCTVTDTIKVQDFAPNSFDILHDTIACSSTGNYPVSANYPGAISYSWNDGFTHPDRILLSSGIYWVDFTFPGGCVLRDSFHLTLIHKPKVNIGNDTIICPTNAHPFTLNAGTGYNYQWSTGATTQTITVNTSGNYSVQVMTTNPGCFTIDTINVIYLNPALVNETIDSSFCDATSFPFILQDNSLNVHNSNISYTWGSGPSGYPVDTIRYAGTYQLTVSIYNNCYIQHTYHINLDTSKPHVKDIVECSSPFKAVVAHAGTGFLQYLWSTGSTADSAVIFNTGNYWVKVKNATGCTYIDTFSVKLVQPQNINIFSDTVSICSESFGTILDASVPGAVSYQWSNFYTTSYSWIQNTGDYWVKVFFSGGCMVQDDFHVIIKNAPYVALGNDVAYCDSLMHSTILDAGSGSPNPSNTYLWSTGATSQTISVSSTNAYWVAVTGTNGCKSYDTINVQFWPTGRSIYVFDTTLCNPSLPVTLKSNVVDHYSYYHWSPNLTYGQNINYAYAGGTYYVDIRIAYNGSCYVTDTFHVKLRTIEMPTIPDITRCNNTSPYLMDAGVGYQNYQWSTGDTTQTILVNIPGKYWITVSDSGCAATDTITVRYLSSPVINQIKDTSFCLHTTLPLNATYPSADYYLWSTGSTVATETIVAPGTYWVTYTLNTSCIVCDTFNVFIKTPTRIDVIPDTAICNRQIITLDASLAGVNYYLWDNGTNSPIRNFSGVGNYWITYSSSSVCAVDSFRINYRILKGDIAVPNIVTPNGDGINDFIDFEGNNEFREFKLSIFNRWGQKVFECPDEECVWVPNDEDGTYYYIFEYNLECGSENKSNVMKGFITVVR